MMMQDTELQEAIEQFVGAFEVVFDQDWAYGRDHMVYQMDRIIPPGETFLHASRDSERVNWGSRAALLQAYERLVTVMKDRGMEPSRPIRDKYFVYSWKERWQPWRRQHPLHPPKPDQSGGGTE